MLRVPDASAISLRSFIVQAIAPGSTIITDGWEGYNGLEAHGYTREVRVKRRSGGSTTKLLPLVHRVVSLLKRWILGTHQGAVSPDHIDYYLDEFTFRFNRRSSRHRGKLFYRLLQHAMLVDPTTYGDIIKHVRGPKRRSHNM